MVIFNTLPIFRYELVFKIEVYQVLQWKKQLVVFVSKDERMYMNYK